MGEGGREIPRWVLLGSLRITATCTAPVRQKEASLKCTSALLQMNIQQWKENRCDESDFPHRGLATDWGGLLKGLQIAILFSLPVF